jgi:hypothetical protein
MLRRGGRRAGRPPDIGPDLSASVYQKQATLRYNGVRRRRLSSVFRDCIAVAMFRFGLEDKKRQFEGENTNSVRYGMPIGSSPRYRSRLFLTNL